MLEMLFKLLEIPSPSGYTDQIVHFVGEELGRLGIPYELSRRGAIRATLRGEQAAPARSIVVHLDTIGAMVRALKPNGRLEVMSVGSWNARFAEGCRVTIMGREHSWRGTILPLKASGHIYNEEVDTQPAGWEYLEVRVDIKTCERIDDLRAAGIRVGDFIAIDPSPEQAGDGFISSRHLDDKAGVAAVLATAKAVVEADVEIPIDVRLLFTIFEEVGAGASAVLTGDDVAEMIAVDNATPGPGQNSTEYGVTIAMMDASGPFDYHLTHHLLDLAEEFAIPHARDVFRYYHSDATSAVEAGNDIRCALASFGVDSSHGYERTHVESIEALAQLLAIYVQSKTVVKRDRLELGPMEGFPTQPLPEGVEMPDHPEDE